MDSVPPREYALYLRKSNGPIGILRQRTATTTYIKGKGGVIGPVFEDADRTAFRKGTDRPEREGFDEMLGWLSQRSGAGAAAWHADRFVRDPEEAELLIRVCRDRGHMVETKAGGAYDMSTANGRKHFRQDALDATTEVDHNTERIIEQKAEAAAAGLWLGGLRPFGWEGIPAEPGSETKFLGLRVVPLEAAALRSAAGAILEGTSVTSIAAEWNARGIKGTSGGPWDAGRLKRVLLRPRNAGLVVHNGVEKGTAQWDPVMPLEVFRALEVKLNGRRKPGHPSARVWQGSGLYRCGVCDKPVGVHGGTGGHHRTSYTCPGHVARQAVKVDKHVSAIVTAYLGRLEAAAALAAATVPRGEDVTLLRAQITAIEGRRKRVAERYVDGTADDDELDASVARAREEIAALEKRIAEAGRVNPLTSVAGDQRIGEKWPGYPVSRRQAIIRELLVVRIHPAGPGRPPGVQWPETWFDRDLIEILPGPVFGAAAPAAPLTVP
jgi:DNA invertase Pin-like site-specific DNA recombinase